MSPDRSPEQPSQPSGDEGLIQIAPGVRVEPAVLRFRFASSSGPGGQNVNRRATKAQLWVDPADLPITEPARRRLIKLGARYLTDAGELQIQSDGSRSQAGNREACLLRLRGLLLEAMKPPRPRKKTKPTRGSIERRIKAKKERGEIKRRRQKPFD